MKILEHQALQPYRAAAVTATVISTSLVTTGTGGVLLRAVPVAPVPGHEQPSQQCRQARSSVELGFSVRCLRINLFDSFDCLPAKRIYLRNSTTNYLFIRQHMIYFWQFPSFPC